MYQSEYPLLISHHLNSTKQATPPQLHSAFRSFNATGYRTGTVCSQCGCYGHKRQHRFYGCLLLQTFFCCTLKKKTPKIALHTWVLVLNHPFQKKTRNRQGCCFFFSAPPKKKLVKPPFTFGSTHHPQPVTKMKDFCSKKKWSSSWWLSRNPHPGG